MPKLNYIASFLIILFITAKNKILYAFRDKKKFFRDHAYFEIFFLIIN